MASSVSVSPDRSPAHKGLAKMPAIPLPPRQPTAARPATEAYGGGIRFGDRSGRGGVGCWENLRCLKPAAHKVWGSAKPATAFPGSRQRAVRQLGGTMFSAPRDGLRLRLALCSLAKKRAPY
jgi:hypothetical protein